MGNATATLVKAIQELEAEAGRIATALVQARNALATMNNGAAPVASPDRRGDLPFKRKYDRNARELIVGLMQQTRRPMHVGDVAAILADRGYVFKKQTVAFTLRKMELAHELRRVKATSGSGYSYAYMLNESALTRGGERP